jgi:hypothetical protein
MRKKHGIAPSTNVKSFYNKDKCKPYYDGLFEASMFMFDGIKQAENAK